MAKYDYLIVGSGLFGAVCAHELTKRNFRVLVIDRRSHVGGNIYTERIEGIDVHKYGPHIFHTSDPEIWAYVNQFAEFNNYVNSPIANYKGNLYNLPFNMNTFVKIWNDVHTPEEARTKITKEIISCQSERPRNLEEQAINLVGKTIYERLIKGYTEKQWGRSCDELPAFIIRRLPVRFTFDNNYFRDRYQGIPVGGYTKMIERMLEGADVRLNCDYFAHRSEFDAEKIIYTGPIDQFFDYRFGMLQYRSLCFETKILNIANYQGVAVMNYTDKETPWTRIIEHKHFAFGEQPKTVITYEYSTVWQAGAEPYYPINDERNNNLYAQYKELADRLPDVYFGGRLGLYRYLDMHVVIKEALTLIDHIMTDGSK